MFIKKASLKLQVEAAAGLLPERGHPPDDPQGDDESHADRQHDQGPPWLPHTTEIPVDAEFNAHRQKPSRPDDQGNGGSQCDYSKIIPDVMGITAGSEPFATSGEQAFVRAIFT